MFIACHYFIGSYIVHVMSVSAYAHTSIRNQCSRVSIGLHFSKSCPSLVPVNWLLRFFYFDSTVLEPTVLPRALTCNDNCLTKGGFSQEIGVVSFVSIFLYKGVGDKLMNEPNAPFVIFFLSVVARLPWSLDSQWGDHW